MSGTSLAARLDSLRAFRYPAYVRLWSGAFVSNLGTFVQSISIGVYATQATGQAAWTGTMAALAYLPAVVLSPLGGGLADRMDRRRLIAALTLVQAATALAQAGMALSAGVATDEAGALAGSAAAQALLVPMAALVFISGCANALAGPAFSALLSEVVSSDDLLSSVSLASAQFNLARILGPLLAALVFTAGGLPLAFAVNALSYVGVLVAVLYRAPHRRVRPVAGESLWQGIAIGLRIAREDPGLRLALPLVAALAMLIAPFIGLMPAYAINAFGRGAAGASWLATAQGAGALIAALTANAVAQRWGVRHLLNKALLAVAPIAVCYWLAPMYGLAFVLLIALGATYLWSLTALSTTCMGRVAPGLQARMNSLYSVTLSGGYAVGLFAQGWLADRWGLRAVPVGAAALLLGVALVLSKRRAFAAIEQPSAFGGKALAAGASGRTTDALGEPGWLTPADPEEAPPLAAPGPDDRCAAR